MKTAPSCITNSPRRNHIYSGNSHDRRLLRRAARRDATNWKQKMFPIGSKS